MEGSLLREQVQVQVRDQRARTPACGTGSDAPHRRVQSLQSAESLSGSDRFAILPRAMAVDDRDFRERLERFLAAELHADEVRITTLARSTEGFSQETFRFDLEIRHGATRTTERYVAKREPVAGLLEPYDLEPEFRVLHTLSDDPFPSPPTPWFSRDPAVLDRPFYVMKCLPGEISRG
jgi:hypothetical protein